MQQQDIILVGSGVRKICINKFPENNYDGLAEKNESLWYLAKNAWAVNTLPTYFGQKIYSPILFV